MNRLSHALFTEKIVAAAELETGLYGMLEPALVARLGKLVDWINARGPYTPDETNAMRRQVEQILVTRLKLSGDRKRIAAISQEQIEQPVFVIGFGRSGTTLLHSLLAEDPAVHAPRWWHSHVPSPPPGEGPICSQRMARAEREIDQLLDYVPGLLPLHPYWDKRAQALIEDEEIFTLDFRNAYPTLLYKVPTLAVMVDVGSEDVRGPLGFHREFLQHLQWNTGKRRWACKGVSHQFLLEALFETYPDALCVWTHRDPVQIQASVLTIASVLYDAITSGKTDWKAYARATVEGIKAGLDCVLSSPLIDDPRVVHINFNELTSDPIGCVRQVYERGRLPFTAEFATRMRAWLNDPENRADRYGRYGYSLEPFGLEADWVREQFAPYIRRFELA